MDPEIEQVPVQTTDQRPHARAPSLPSEVIVLDESNSSQPAQREGALDNLEEALENACETLNTISETVIKFSFDSQHILFGKINEFVRDLREVDRWSKQIDVTIPAEVIDAIDKGRNPEVCTSQMLESCAEANNVAMGKLSAVEQFRDELEKSVREAEAQGKLQLPKDELVGKTVSDLHVDANVANSASVNPSNHF